LFALKSDHNLYREYLRNLLISNESLGIDDDRVVRYTIYNMQIIYIDRLSFILIYIPILMI